MNPAGTVALVVHRARPEALAGARRALDWLQGHGYQVWMGPQDAEALDRAGTAHAGTTHAGPAHAGPAHAGPARSSADGITPPPVELAVALGGDGTILRAVGLASGSGAPVLGVNLGRMGFLTGVEPAGLEEALGRWRTGDFEVENRMVMEVTLSRPGLDTSAIDGLGVEPSPESTPDPGADDLPARAGVDAGESWFALNEAVVERPEPGHVLRVAVAIGGRPWTSYAADGLIVTTPTGSTAYAFSAGGPILSPRLQALQLTPVAPHMPFGRSLVVDRSETIEVTLDTSPAALVVIDGRSVATMATGDRLRCSAAEHPARFVALGPRNFYGVLKAKFGVVDR
ncbi:MAG: NAD(+)/NADH kinase [Acidimicrobiales bacterium]